MIGGGEASSKVVLSLVTKYGSCVIFMFEMCVRCKTDEPSIGAWDFWRETDEKSPRPPKMSFLTFGYGKNAFDLSFLHVLLVNYQLDYKPRYGGFAVDKNSRCQPSQHQSTYIYCKIGFVSSQ